MSIVLIMWFISQSAISVTSAQFERIDECREALRSVQAEFSGANLAITVGGGCYQTTAKP
jgi:hypothetical protein